MRFICYNSIFRHSKVTEEIKEDSVHVAPSMNSLAIDRINQAKQMMINFGPIELVYQRESSGFECLKPVNLPELRARLRKIHDLVREAYQASQSTTYALFDHDSNAYCNEISKCKDDNLSWFDKLGFPHASVTAQHGAPPDLSKRVLVLQTAPID